MGYKLNLPQPAKIDPNKAANEFCREIRRLIRWLEFKTYCPEDQWEARKRINELCYQYNRDCGDGYRSRLVQLANGVHYKVAEIVNLNFRDWNNYRRGQQFRRLDEKLLVFEIERYRSISALKERNNILLFPKL